MERENWIDFKKLKEEVGFAVVLDKLGLLEEMTLEGDEFVGFCSLHEGEKKKKSFYANGRKGIFHCFACGKKGNVLDFVRLYQGGSLKEAGFWLQELVNGGEKDSEKLDPKVTETSAKNDPLEGKLEEVFLILISRVEKHFEDKGALARKLTRWVVGLID